MDFELSEEQLALRNLLRDFAKKEIAPIVEVDEKEKRPLRRELIKKMGEMGFYGCGFPVSEGGVGMGTLASATVQEELSRAWTAVGMILNLHSGSLPTAIYLFGTPTQRAKYMRPIIQGDARGCFGLTEPDAGSDAAAIKTRAVKQDGYYVVNGTKMWTTTGTTADFVLLFVRTSDHPGAKGMSALLVDLNSPGIERHKLDVCIGTNCVDTAEVVFEDCRVPEGNRLGEEQEGFIVATSALDFGRISVAARAVGLAQAALDQGLKYANEREAFGQKIGRFQLVQSLIVDGVVGVEAARLLVYKAAWTADKGLPFMRQAAIAKYYAGDVAKRTADAVAEIHGAYAFANDYVIARLKEAAGVHRTGEGPANIQKIMIGEDALGIRNANRHPRRSPRYQ